MNKHDSVFGVTKRFVSDNIFYYFDKATIEVNTTDNRMQVYHNSNFPNADATKFTDITDNLGAANIEQYVDLLAENGLYRNLATLSGSEIILSSVQTIRNVSDFPDTLSPTTLYLIDNMGNGVDMGDRQLESATDIYLRGQSNNKGGLFSTSENYEMFVGGGNIFLDRLRLSASGINSKIFNSSDLTGNNAVECTTVNFENSTSIGTLTDYRQGLWQNVGIFGVADGLEMAGDWGGGMAIFTAIARGFDTSNTGGVILKASQTATFGGRIISNGNFEVNGTSKAYSFVETNFTQDQQFQLIEGELTGTGTYVDGITVASTKCLWNTRGIPKTSPGAKMVFTASATTTIPATNTPVKLAGTTTLSDAIWVDMPANNRLRWLSEFDGEMQLLGFLSLSGGANDQLALRVRVFNKLDVLQNDFQYPTITANGGLLGSRAENIAIGEFFDMRKNWYVEVFVENTTDDSNIDVIVNSKVLLKQRTSI